jgi:hypothetical protein
MVVRQRDGHSRAAREGVPRIGNTTRPQLPARWLAAGANQKNGIRRTNADKRRAVEMALKAQPKKSYRAVATHVGVSQPFVGSVRSTDNRYQSSERTGRDGRTTNTSNIGRREERNSETDTGREKPEPRQQSFYSPRDMEIISRCPHSSSLRCRACPSGTRCPGTSVSLIETLACRCKSIRAVRLDEGPGGSPVVNRRLPTGPESLLSFSAARVVGIDPLTEFTR